LGDAPHNRGRGRVGEEAAARYLTGRGYEILERNVDTAAGEIDVVARDGDTLCFIEVKARLSDRFGPAVTAVTAAKRRRLVRAAALYLAYRREPGGPVRFDVLGLDREGESLRFTLIQDAFQAGS
jgi:putative endonuclease